MDYLVPDSIEPIRGWRSWDFDPEHGLLISCTNDTSWTPRKPTQAKCYSQYMDHTQGVFEWVQEPGVGSLTDEDAWKFVLGSDHIPDWEFPSSSNTVGNASTLNIFHADWFPHGVSIPVRPTEEPDEGYGWQLIRYGFNEHFSPSESCTCGIYFRKQMTMEYVSMNAIEVFGEVAGWGHVIPAENGARVEFAYPQKLYLLDNIDFPKSEIFSYAMKLQENYGVPVIYDQKRVNAALDEQIAGGSCIRSMILRDLPPPVISKALRKRQPTWIPFMTFCFGIVNAALYYVTGSLMSAISAMIILFASALLLFMMKTV